MPANSTVNAWSTSQLVEFLAVLSDQPDEASARRAALERVLESLDAQVGVLFGPDVPLVVVGLRDDDPAVSELTTTASAEWAPGGTARAPTPGPGGTARAPTPGPGGTARAPTPGPGGTWTVPVDVLGPCQVVAVPLDVGDATRLLVARAGRAGFQPDEMLLLRGMAWVLALALRPLRFAAELDRRQRLLEHTARIQEDIAGRTPLPEVFDRVTASLLDLSGADLAMLHLAEREDLVLASSRSSRTGYRTDELIRGDAGLSERVYASQTLIRTDDYRSLPGAQPGLVRLGASAAMGTPVHENGSVAGTLTVISLRAGHRFTDAQEQALRTFADQVSVAMSDARTLATAQRALRDPVTGLPNRMYFLEALQHALDRESPVEVLFLDLDRFKYVNDTFGHSAGDDLLRHVGHRLRETLRSGDLLARFGGDEYAVLMENASEPAAVRCGTRMLAAVQETCLVGPEDVVVGGSIGVASGQDCPSADEVMRDADTAMYQAKHAGGGKVVVFRPQMRVEVLRRHTVEADLRRALQAGAIRIVFQPAVDLASRRTRAAEALARWTHPKRGAVAPADFIPLAEENGLIIPLGRQILAAGCAEAARWPVPPHGQRPDVSVNISTRQMLDPSFLPDVNAILAETGLDPRRLILEITESTLASDLDRVLEVMRRLRGSGIRLAVDDFGTGYSSLAYLRMFPVDILKIDRSFVESIGAAWQGRAFVRTITRLAQTLSMTSIAEGVETVEQARTLREVGCDLGQGYLFAKPMPPEEFATHLQRHPGDSDTTGG